MTRSSAPSGTALMGSTSIIVGEDVTPTSPAEAPTASAARGGVFTFASATGGEVTTFSTAPCGGVAVCVHLQASPPRPVAQATSCGRETMGQMAPLVALPLACMVKHLVKTKIR
jgi:hypothetical protein